MNTYDSEPKCTVYFSDIVLGLLVSLFRLNMAFKLWSKKLIISNAYYPVRGKLPWFLILL